MKIIKSYPPNIAQIKEYLSLSDGVVFCYGDTIYCPSTDEIPEDVVEHEKVHSRQQKQFLSSDVWWNKYLLDKDFRLSQELEAYRYQYKWICDTMGKGVGRQAIVELASNLKDLYGVKLTYGQAERLIKKHEIVHTIQN